MEVAAHLSDKGHRGRVVQFGRTLVVCKACPVAGRSRKPTAPIYTRVAVRRGVATTRGCRFESYPVHSPQGGWLRNQWRTDAPICWGAAGGPKTGSTPVQPVNMELTAEEVDQIEAVRKLVEDLIGYAEEHPDSAFDKRNLVILEAQLEGLHQGLSLAVAQKDALEDVEIGGGSE